MWTGRGWGALLLYCFVGRYRLQRAQEGLELVRLLTVVSGWRGGVHEVSGVFLTRSMRYESSASKVTRID